MTEVIDGVQYEEVPEPHVIETGDSVKVKQVLDEVTVNTIEDDCGHVVDWSWDNFKLLLMFISCVFAMGAQFYPQPFPDSRPILALCCAMYFAITSGLQYIISFVDLDDIMFLKAAPGKFEDTVVVSTSFPKYQEWFILSFKYKSDAAKATTAKMYIGKYFTSLGEFEEDVYKKDVKHALELFIAKKYVEQEYNHKMD